MERILLCLAALDGNDNVFMNNLATMFYRHLKKHGRSERMDGEAARRKARVMRMVLEIDNPEYIKLVGRFARPLSE